MALNRDRILGDNVPTGMEHRRLTGQVDVVPVAVNGDRRDSGSSLGLLSCLDGGCPMSMDVCQLHQLQHQAWTLHRSGLLLGGILDQGGPGDLADHQPRRWHRQSAGRHVEPIACTEKAVAQPIGIPIASREERATNLITKWQSGPPLFVSESKHKCDRPLIRRSP